MLSISASSTLPISTAQFSERLEQNHNKESQGLEDRSSDENRLKKDSSTELAEQRQLQSLKTRDREVKAHELAHASVGGQYASGASFTYEKGSDGVLYAVAGEVSISTSAVAGDPKATLDKAQIIQRAALAPANPSSQDRSVAASAGALAQQARIEIAQLVEIESYSNKSFETGKGIDEVA